MLSHYDRNKIEIMKNKLLKLVGRVIDCNLFDINFLCENFYLL